MSKSTVPALFALLLSLVACGGGDPAADAVADAESKLMAGDVPAAVDAYQAASAEHPESYDAAVGAAYGAFLQGDLERAQSLLASAAEAHPDRRGEIAIRQALVALEAGDLDQVRSFGEASGLPAGQLLAAEVALADGERDAARALLEPAVAGGGEIAATANAYLTLMSDADPRAQGLSEVQALWALGQRRVAVRSVEELVKTLPDDRENKAELLLLWAGRAAAAGEPQVASNLVESISFPPPGQQWRKIATQGIVACAEGDGEKCISILDGLEAAAPPAGMRDARATAAILLAAHDAEMAREVVGDDPSPAVARALLEAGDLAGARQQATRGTFARYLEALGG